MTKQLRILGVWLSLGLWTVGCSGSDGLTTDAGVTPAETPDGGTVADGGTVRVDLDAKAADLQDALETWMSAEGVVGSSAVILTDDGQALSRRLRSRRRLPWRWGG